MTKERKSGKESALTSHYEIFESMKTPVCIIGVDGILNYGNKSFLQLYGSDEGGLRLDLQHPLYPEYRKRLAQAYLSTLQGNERQCFAVIESAKGKQIPAEIYLYPMLDGQEVTAILGQAVVSANRHQGIYTLKLIEISPRC